MDPQMVFDVQSQEAFSLGKRKPPSQGAREPGAGVWTLPLMSWAIKSNNSKLLKPQVP